MLRWAIPICSKKAKALETSSNRVSSYYGLKYVPLDILYFIIYVKESSNCSVTILNVKSLLIFLFVFG